MIKKLIKRIFRNQIDINGNICRPQRVTLEYWQKRVNLGDTLAKVIFEWILDEHDLPNQALHRYTHLSTVGSILGASSSDKIVWGSGLKDAEQISKVYNHRKLVAYDVRAVRGPVTALFLQQSGYDCKNAVYGDPGVLMPLIYPCSNRQKQYRVSVIAHLHTHLDMQDDNIHFIDVKTDDYRFFIDEIVKSELVITESLHGIILAEAYGVPAIFLNLNVSNQLMKYYDYYYSTGRYDIPVAKSLEEALTMEPLPLPALNGMQQKLLACFPYEIFDGGQRYAKQ